MEVPPFSFCSRTMSSDLEKRDPIKSILTNKIRKKDITNQLALILSFQGVWRH